MGIGEITHGHFGAKRGNQSREEAEREVVEKVLNCVDLLFRNRVYLWLARCGSSGGWGPVENLRKPPFMPGHNRYFLLSGPVRRSLRMRSAGFLLQRFSEFCRFENRD